MTMSVEQRALAVAEEEERREPGMGSALLAILVMLFTTAVISALIYLVMIAIRPIEARNFKKAAEIEKPAVEAPSTAAPRA